MEIGKHWKTIQAIFNEGRRSCRHFAVATVGQDGSPHVTPIGSLFLRDDETGFFFDEFPCALSNNVARNPRVCVLAVNAAPTFWQESIVAGRFATAPAVRLMGSMGERREGTAEEIALWQDHIKMSRGTKGHALLWKDMRTVRDVTFDGFEPVLCGAMTPFPWQ
jgi:uncharacterized protein